MVFYLLLSVVPFNLSAQTKQQDYCNSVDLKHLFEDVLNSMDARDYDLSIAKSLNIIEKAEEKKCYDYLFDAYNLLSRSYIDLRDTVPAQRYAKKALSYAELSKNDTLLADAYNNLAAFYVNDEKDHAKAMDLYKKSLVLARKIKDSSFLNAALNIAELYRNMGNYKAMPKYLQEAANSVNKINIQYDDPRIYLDILWGDYYYHNNKEQCALKHYEQAYERVEKDSIRLLAIDFYGRYADRLSAQQSYQKAFEVEKRLLYHEQVAYSIESEESLLNAKANAQMQAYKRQRNEAKLQQQLADQNLKRKSREGLLLGILLVLLIIFIGYLFLSTRFRKSLIISLKKNNIALQKAKNIAEKSSAAKAHFFSTLSHEMRTPLYGVTGIVSLLEKSPHFKSHKEELSSLQFSASHLLDIINDLLDISKLENDTFELQNRPFNLRNLVKEIVNSVDHYAADQKSTVHLEVSPSVPNYLIGDSRRLSQVLLNILSNSMKFTKNGDIWVYIESTKKEAGSYDMAFSIKDNGVGMDEKSQRLIFNEFSQVGNEIEDQERQGTGLGLPIVKKILEKMKSAIHLESERDVGTQFRFNITFEEATLLQVIEFSSSQKYKAKKDKEHTVRGISFLIVDDNKINRMVTSKILIERGAKTAEASSGKEAIEKVKEEHYDLILMDINMPVMNGFETTLELRRLNIQVPIIALTAADASYMEKRIKTNGMSGAIIKPYSMDEFMKVINEHLSTNKKTISL